MRSWEMKQAASPRHGVVPVVPESLDTLPSVVPRHGLRGWASMDTATHQTSYSDRYYRYYSYNKAAKSGAYGVVPP